MTGIAVKNARGPETNANTATVGKYVKTKRAMVTHTVKMVDVMSAGRTGLRRVGCVTKWYWPCECVSYKK
jgi:hypothetical protein